MTTHYRVTTSLAVILSSVPSILGLPQITDVGDVTGGNPTVFQPWSSHPECAAPRTACKTDCTQAVKNLCQKDLGTENLIETVGECTAWYLYQLGNTLPTYDQCYSSFAYINDAGKPDPDGCGGTFGGALGFDKNGDRTNDPAFAIYPTSGNGNCLSTDTPDGPPLPQNLTKQGMEVPIDGECPTQVSRRDIGNIPTSFGTGAAIGILPCLGGCDAVGFKLLKNCEKDHPIGGKLKARQIGDGSLSPECAGTQSVAFECQAVKQIFLDSHRCDQASSEGEEVGSEGSGADPGRILT
ncbi:MAG: hypothetical protein Q9174_003527 [Haloplaca sp. 1 TL-2023]